MCIRIMLCELLLARDLIAVLEYEGLPPPLVSDWKTVAQRRLALLQPHVKRIEFL